jgi:hypothetical protein
MKKIIIIIFLFLVSFYFLRNSIAKAIVSGGVKGISGLSLEIDSMDIGIFSSSVKAKGLRLLNPANFPEKTMIEMPEFYLEYDLPMVLKGNIHLKAVKLDLQKFLVIKNQNGELNLRSLKSFQPKGSAKAAELRIDILELKIGSVIYKDYSNGMPPKITEFNVNIDQSYKDITNPKALVSLILVKALMNTTISKLANFNLVPLRDMADQIVDSTVDMAKDTAGQLLGAGQKIGISAVGNMADTLDSAAEKFRKILP